jgi:hypothetical protein
VRSYIGKNTATPILDDLQTSRNVSSGSHFEIGLDLCCGELTQVGFFGGPLEARLIPPSRGQARFAHRDDAWRLCRAAGQATRAQCPLRHGRYRHGSVFCFLHAEPVVSRAAAPVARRLRPLELPDAVRDGRNPERQPHPRNARPAIARRFPARVRRHDPDA